jgi:hypothetical protein
MLQLHGCALPHHILVVRAFLAKEPRPEADKVRRADSIYLALEPGRQQGEEKDVNLAGLAPPLNVGVGVKRTIAMSRRPSTGASPSWRSMEDIRMRRDLLKRAESFGEERIEHRRKHQREDQLDDRVALDDESDNRQDNGEECSCGVSSVRCRICFAVTYR